MRHIRDKAMLFCAAAGLALLSACSGGASDNSLAAIDNQIAAGDIDPAVTSAIEDEILVDPNLVQQANPKGVRHPERPLQAPYPAGDFVRAGAGATDGSAAAADPDGPLVAPCGAPFQYGAEWAERLPADFPPYPGGRVTEAAGADAGACQARVVTFATDHRWQQVIEWYRGVAMRAGYDAEHEAQGSDQVLGGVKGENAYLVIVTPEQNGSKVAVIVNTGR